jgi:hypothetical protein
MSENENKREREGFQIGMARAMLAPPHLVYGTYYVPVPGSLFEPRVYTARIRYGTGRLV